MDRPPLSIVVPMFNEAARIESTLTLLADSHLAGAEFVLVDDGSDDGSGAVAGGMLATLGLDGFVVERPHRGKGAAVVEGAAASHGAVVVFVDADLSTDVASVERVVARMGEADVDLAIGSRRHPDSVIARRQPLRRELAGRVFNLTLRAMGLTRLRDTQCGLKAFTRPALDETLLPSSTSGYVFDVEVLSRAEAAGLSVVEVPVTWYHDDGSAVRLGADLLPVARELLALRRVRNSISDGR